jgi:dipeptidyl aminopeptidase/acylaminoacyl peptidase
LSAIDIFMAHPYGTWRSPITAASIASQNIGLSAVSVDRGTIHWLESRPQEGGRSLLVRLDHAQRYQEVTPPGSNIRTRVHEYGGGACLVDEGEVFFVEFGDQRVYRQRGGAPASPLTPVGQARYADFVSDRSRARLYCVQEDHSSGGEPVNSLVSIDMDPRHELAAPQVIASGHDFYASPRLSADRRHLAWLAWRHPNMPWDGTELRVASINQDGELEHERCVAGGVKESICQPGWSAEGDLYFVSDRDGWWRLYRLRAPQLEGPAGGRLPHAEPVMTSPPGDAEFGRPMWVLGGSIWAFVDSSTIVATFTRQGRSGLLLVNVGDGSWREVPTTLESLDNLTILGSDVIFIGGSPTQLPSLVRMSLATGNVQQLRASSSMAIEPTYISVAESVMFPSDEGRPTHAFFYPPCNPGQAAEPDSRPPLIVIGHGGPTDAARSSLRLGIQFWTTRGFAVVDVDYGGSTGFGRAYRERLNGQWGIVDVADCVNAAAFLVREGRVDPERLIIRGGSAGGYTALAALTTRPEVFKAAASYYGICDLEVLVSDTHKFESRYTDRLIGPHPQRRDLYRERSPIHKIERLSCPLILFHGAEDKVVPLNQAEIMAAAVRAKGLPVALMIFANEQHGFRHAANTVRSLEAELWFYGAVLGFSPADTIEPVEISNPRGEGQPVRPVDGA